MTNEQKTQAFINHLHELADEILQATKEIPNFNPKQPLHPDLFDGRYKDEEIQWAQQYLIRLGLI